MSDDVPSSAPKWIIIVTALLTLAGAGLTVGIKVFELQKARSDAEQATAGKSVPPAADPLPLVAKSPQTPAASRTGSREPAPKEVPPPLVDSPPGVPPPEHKIPAPLPAFQPRSTPTDTIKVGHGHVEVTARATAEDCIVISIVGRNFGGDLSPLSKWVGTTGDLLKRKIEQLGLGSGTWTVSGPTGSFVVRDGVASMEVTFRRQK